MQCCNDTVLSHYGGWHHSCLDWHSAFIYRLGLQNMQSIKLLSQCDIRKEFEVLKIISHKIKIKRNQSPLIINLLILLSPFRLVLFFPGGLVSSPSSACWLSSQSLY